jgi:hypothetical protein
MADNVAITAGAGTTIATDDVGTVHYQVVKLAVGADGAASLISSSAPLPVEQGTVSTKHFVAAATTNPTSVKAGAGTLKGFYVFNKSAVPVYLKFHNTAGAPTAGAGIVMTYGIQAGTSSRVILPEGGIAFGTGIAFTLVTGIADTDATATAANDAAGEIFYE